MTFHASYDRYRPRPPEALLDLLVRLAGGARPALVVDLGSGTGLSARTWSGRADRVVGVEASEDMLKLARARGGGVEYVHAQASATGLPDAAADIVTAAQSLHWMQPEPTLAEIGRILRRGGVFAAYDYDPTPVVEPELDEAFLELRRRTQALRHERGFWAPWSLHGAAIDKGEHLGNMRASGQFRYVREAVAHHVEEGSAERYVGIVQSLGGVEMYKDELGLDEFERLARRKLGDGVVPFWIGYRVRLGIR